MTGLNQVYLKLHREFIAFLCPFRMTDFGRSMSTPSWKWTDWYSLILVGRCRRRVRLLRVHWAHWVAALVTYAGSSLLMCIEITTARPWRFAGPLEYQYRSVSMRNDL